MHILDLPTELFLRIVQAIPSIQDKCRLIQTCKRFGDLLQRHTGCWTALDFSGLGRLDNYDLMGFIERCGMSLSADEPGNQAVRALDISGCGYVWEPMLNAFLKAFLALETLDLNGYQAYKDQQYVRGEPQRLEQLRDHVYQVAPSHGLSSMHMDLSKKHLEKLKVPFTLLSKRLKALERLQSLSLQYQEIQPLPALPRLRALDISSCRISAADLQSLLRTLGPQLTSLKMLNLDLQHLTVLCLMSCRSLACLHLSINDRGLMGALVLALPYLTCLRDFRMTRMWLGSIDAVVRQLPLGLERLDLSPKMSLYAKTVTGIKTPAAHLKYAHDPKPTSHRHPPQTSTATVGYATLDHALYFTDCALNDLQSCRQLTELRLCFPMISSDALLRYCQAAWTLETFELRLKPSPEPAYAQAILRLTQLKSLALYGVLLAGSDHARLAQDFKQLKTLLLSHTGQAPPPVLDPFLFHAHPSLCLLRSDHPYLVWTKPYPRHPWQVQA
ncbi:hypothetical protein BY458DRAFT_524278 [Sporodiniella umbellata]|nr:hypothetical protein BY458DRAFT_524278 [Sporodiniella umbellata]